jgi:acetyl-CoA acetyltransferase
VRRDILVVDSEVSPFGTHDRHDSIRCAAGPARAVLDRHPDLAGRIDLVVVGTGMAARTEGRENGLAQSLAGVLGLGGSYGIDVREFCASGNVAVQVAATAIEAARAEVVLVLGVDHLVSGDVPRPLRPEAVGVEAAYGYSPPVFYALCADRYLRETGTSVADLAAVAVRNRRHAASNPNARFREAITEADVLESPLVAPPLTRLQCCPNADGSGAVLVVAADAVDADTAKRAVRLTGMGAATNASPHTASLLSFAEDVDAGRRAYEDAGLGPSDVDVAEVHDAFTISQVIHLEDLGLRERGEGWRDLPGLVVNPSGGLLSRGHPIGATGIAQVDSIRRHLCGEWAGSSGSFRTGLVQEAGGMQVLGQILSTCLILQAPLAR